MTILSKLIEQAFLVILQRIFFALSKHPAINDNQELQARHDSDPQVVHKSNLDLLDRRNVDTWPLITDNIYHFSVNQLLK